MEPSNRMGKEGKLRERVFGDETPSEDKVALTHRYAGGVGLAWWNGLIPLETRSFWLYLQLVLGSMFKFEI